MRKILRTYSGLPFQIYILFISRIINRMGDFVHIFLTLFLTTRMGMDERETGFFLMIVGLSRVAGVLSGGKSADYFGRKIVMITGQVLSAVFLIPCGFLGNSIIIPWLMVLSGFFNGAVRPASGSMVADLSGGDKRKDAYSLMYLGTNFGVAVGPLIAGFLFKNHTNWIFWGDAATTMTSAFMITCFIKESRPGEEEENESLVSGPEKEKLVKTGTLRAITARPLLLIFSFLTFMANALYSQHSFLIPLQLEIIYPGESAHLFGYMMSFNAVTVLVMTSVILLVSRGKSPIRNMGYAAFCYAAGFGMLYQCRIFSLFILSAFIWTIGEILMVTNFSVYLADNSPINHRGRFNSFLNTVTGLGHVAGPFITGIVSEKIGITRTWPVVAATGIILGISLFFLEKVENHAE